MPSKGPRGSKSFAYRALTRLRCALGGVVVLSLLSACGSGDLEVSYPQVHTRERLVAERQRESCWLLEQLKKTDTIDTSPQVYHDYRQFMGVYSELQATMDPTSGVMAQSQIANAALDFEEEMWRKRTRVLEARRAYDRALADEDEPPDSKAGEGVIPPTKGDGATKDASKEGLEPGKAPFGRGLAETKDALPDPKNLSKSEAKAHPQDELSEKLSYRNTINAHLRATQLDDGHDQAGFMLYELTLHASLAPSGSDHRYAQVTLEMVSLPRDQRASSLAKLYTRWRGDLTSSMAAQVSQLQSRYLTGTLDSREKAFLRWFVERGLISLLQDRRMLQADLAQVASIAEEVARGAGGVPRALREIGVALGSQGRYELLDAYVRFLRTVATSREEPNVPPSQSLDSWAVTMKREIDRLYDVELPDSTGQPAKDRVLESLQVLRTKFTSLMSAIDANTSKDPLELHLEAPGAKCQDADLRKAVCKALAWAVYLIHQNQLTRYVVITTPQFEEDGLFKSGMEALPVAPVTDERDLATALDGRVGLTPSIIDGGSAGPIAPAPELSWLLGSEPGVEPMGDDVSFRCRNNVFSPLLGFGETGVYAFISTLHRAEMRAHALTVEPKDMAQSISEASAREDLINLILSVKALIPQFGTTVGSDSQFIDKTREVLHAINRRPLLVGFGAGQRRFGWMLGPRLVIEDGKMEFDHRPVHHECSAGVVVPAWWTHIRIKAFQRWLSDGSPFGDAGHALWGGETEELMLPLPPDVSQHITRALVHNRPSDEPFQFTNRPVPIIEHLNGNDIRRSAGQAIELTPLESGGKKTVTVLVEGRNLWRSPQVFLGSQLATSVEVTANMEGLLCTFDNITVPQQGAGNDRSVPLTVVTSSGRHAIQNAVRLVSTPAAGEEGQPVTRREP